MRAKLFSLCVLLAIAFRAGAAPPPADNTTYYAYCTLVDNVRSTVYFSDIFLGDSSRTSIFVDSFHQYLHRVYPRIYGTPQCTYSDGIYNARRNKDSRVKLYSSAYRSVVDTGWTF